MKLYVKNQPNRAFREKREVYRNIMFNPYLKLKQTKQGEWLKYIQYKRFFRKALTKLPNLPGRISGFDSPDIDGGKPLNEIEVQEVNYERKSIY